MASATCIASSRVGTSTSAAGRLRPSPCAAIRCRSGSANAAVFPVPVAAWPSRSRPASSGGIGLALDGRRLLVAELREGSHEALVESELQEAAVFPLTGRVDHTGG